MKPLSFKRQQFPAAGSARLHGSTFVSALAFAMEELMAAREIDVGYETIRCWTIKFGLQIARRLKKWRPRLQPACTPRSGLLHRQEADVPVARRR
ncbi:hypothetical protein [Brevundimonas sp.]|uniref:hypothetical protein n=1 Tax=Brevundimonas sp. TaxID=1871086 RepID=UPI0025B965BC|nr:hypothetical protein [Brevundimonas sp.]